MNRTLDIAPLRSFVAVADAGGFQRAADVLHLSQGAVSQHVRRLESAVGALLAARRILELHDEVLAGFSQQATETVVIGLTEHAAAQLLPYLAASLDRLL